MEPIEFLAQTPPFDRLDGERIRLVERSLEIVYAPRGEMILRRADPMNERLFVIRKGAVRLERDRRLVQMLEDGDLFGYPSLLSGKSPTVDVVAEEDSLVYRLPKTTFDKLMEVKPFGEYFLAELAGRIRATIDGDQVALTGILSRGTVERLAEASKGEAGLSREGVETLTEAFRFVLHLRLRDQLRARREGAKIDNTVHLDALASIERRHLKDAFVAIAEFQDSMARRYGTNFIS